MSKSTNAIEVPAEWERHKAIWTAWPSHKNLWEENLDGARQEVAAMIQALSGGDVIKVLACGGEAVASATSSVGNAAEIIAADFGDIWLRDTGPIFARTHKDCIALRFDTNGWGGKYNLPGDNTVGDVVANSADREIIRHDFVLEGGALEHNGAGWILTTRQCLLNPNRNPNWTQAVAERLLTEAFACQQVLWLEEGLLNDHTDGHVDNLARFIGPDTVVCQAATTADDPNANLYNKIASELLAMRLNVLQIPSPGKITNEEGEVVPASHMNFIIGNEHVIVPTYEAELGAAAVSALQQLLPDRTVIGLPSKYLLSGGGSFHCITQQEPLP